MTHTELDRPSHGSLTEGNLTSQMHFLVAEIPLQGHFRDVFP